MVVQPDGKEKMVGGASSIRRDELEDEPRVSMYDNYASGIRYGEESNIAFGPGSNNNSTSCGGERRYKYPRNKKAEARPLEGHAESKIIEDWFSSDTQGTVLYLKIGGSQTTPCDGCDSLIKFVNSSSSTPSCPRVDVCP